MNFKHNWVLSDKLLVGEAPQNKENLNLLKKYNIKSILCLCDENEFQLNDEILNNFKFTRVVLPDHKNNRSITFTEIRKSLSTLINFLKEGKVYIHCFAGLERSPLICMGYLMYSKNITLIESLEYLMSVNPGTSPMQRNLDQLEKFFFNKENLI